MPIQPEEQFVMGYSDFNGNIRLVYVWGSYASIYKSEQDRRVTIDRSKHLALFYAIIDDINEVAYIKQSILKYIADNVYLMNHYPKSASLMKLLFEYATITCDVARI